MNLAEIMDEIAERLSTIPNLRVHAYPPGAVKPPAAVVAYPTQYSFDLTYGRGMDRMNGSVVVVVGRPTERQSRDLLTKYLAGSGADSVKAALDGDDYDSCDSVRVESAEFDIYSIGATDYLTAVFQLDIAGQGA